MLKWLSEVEKSKWGFIVLSLRIPLKDYTAKLNIESYAEVQSHHLWFFVMPYVLFCLIADFKNFFDKEILYTGNVGARLKVKCSSPDPLSSPIDDLHSVFF